MDGLGVPWIGWFIIASGAVILLGALVGLYRRPRWLSETGRGPTLAVGPGLAVLFVYLLALAIGGLILTHLAPGGAAPQTMPAYAQMAWIGLGLRLPALLLWVHLTMVAAREGWLEMAEAPRRPPRPLGYSIGAGVVMLALTWPVVSLAAMAGAFLRAMMTGVPADPLAHETLRFMQGAAADGWLALVVLAVVVGYPVVEEVIYRGTIQPMIRGALRSPWPAIVITAMIFSVQHLPAVTVEALPALLVLGMGFGIAYEWTGRLSAPIVMHVLFNLGNVVLARFVM